MSQWIVTPDKFLTDDESKRLRRYCEEAAIIAKSKGNQMAVRNRLICPKNYRNGVRMLSDFPVKVLTFSRAD